MGYVVRVINLYIIHNDSHDLQSMSATYIEPNKNCCEILFPLLAIFIHFHGLKKLTLINFSFPHMTHSLLQVKKN